MKAALHHSVLTSVRMHLVQSSFFNLRPLASTVTFCRFGRKERLVARIEKDRL